jgi:hypothetical protein
VRLQQARGVASGWLYSDSPLVTALEESRPGSGWCTGSAQHCREHCRIKQQRLAYSVNTFTNTSFDAQNIVSELLPSPEAYHGATAN